MAHKQHKQHGYTGWYLVDGNWVQACTGTLQDIVKGLEPYNGTHALRITRYGTEVWCPLHEVIARVLG